MNNSTEKLRKLLEETTRKNKDLSVEKVTAFRLKNKLRIDDSKNKSDLKNQSVFEEKISKKENYLDDIETVLSKENKLFNEVNKKIPVNYAGNILISCDASNNKNLIVALTKKIISEKKIPIIILTSTNYKTMISFFNEAKIPLNDLYIVDSVSKNIINVHDFEKNIFIDSLRNLTQLQIKLIKILKNQKNTVCVFDSVDVLELYHEEKLILKFVYSIIKLIQKKSTNIIFLINNKSLSFKLSQFFNDFIEIEKIE